MATTLASLVVKIGADVSGVTAGLNTLDRRVRKVKRQFSSVTDSTLRWHSALGLLAGAAGVGFAASRLFQLGSTVEETGSKFRTVLGPGVGSAQAFLDDFANTAGLTIVQGQDLLATTAAIAQGMGFTGAAAQALATDVVQLSGDLSSFNNIPIAETSRAVQAALVGEREMLKRYGIVLLEADVRARALRDTGKSLASELTQQEKATASLALITERAGVAVGDLERTQESSANRARRLSAELLTQRDTIANALLPAFNVILGELARVSGGQGFQGLGDAIQRSGAHIANWTRFSIEAFGFVARAIAAPFRIAFNLGQVLGHLARIVAFVLTRRFVQAANAALDLAGEFADMKDVATGLVTSFDEMRIAAGLAWQTFEDSPLPETNRELETTSRALPFVAEGFIRKAAAIRKTTQEQERLNASSQRYHAILNALGFLGQFVGRISPIISFASTAISVGQGLRGAFAGPATPATPSLPGTKPTKLRSPGGASSLSFVFPPARSPTDAARDPEIARMIEATIRQLEADGFRMA